MMKLVTSYDHLQLGTYHLHITLYPLETVSKLKASCKHLGVNTHHRVKCHIDTLINESNFYTLC